MSGTKNRGAPAELRGPLPWILGGLFIVSSVWFVLLYVRGVAKDSLDMEFAKALLQVGVASVAATVLSLLVFGHQRRIERNELRAEAAAKRQAFRDDVLRMTLERITSSYNRTKRARRKMRALGQQHRTHETVVIFERYDEVMEEVNETQLDLEAIKSDVNTSRLAYQSADTLAASLRSMESYLGELFEEYETIRSTSGPSDTELPLAKAPRLKDFIGPAKGSNFRSGFADPYDAARGAIRGDLFHANFQESPN